MNERWEYLRIVRQTWKGKTGETERPVFIWLPGSDSPEKREDPRFIELLNEFGAQGWELVAEHTSASTALQAYTHPETGQWQPARSFPAEIVWTFKRRAQET